MRVAPYYTTRSGRAVYHDRDDCPVGMSSTTAERRNGVGICRTRCDWCAAAARAEDQASSTIDATWETIRHSA